MKRAALVVLTLGAAAACASGPEVIPFAGIAPRRIVVLPIEAPDLGDAMRDALDEAAHLAVAGRGYEVVPAAVVANAPGETSTERLDRFAADAWLERSAVGTAITWRIFAGREPAVIWSARAELRPGAITSEHLTGPLGLVSEDPLLSDEPIGGRGYGPYRTVVRAHTPQQIAADVQRRLAAQLPRR